MDRGERARMLELLTRASLLVGSLGPSGEFPRHDLEVLALFDRCRSLLGAIRLLLANNFVHEAVLLGRPLFTDSLALAEFAAVDEKRRGELVVGWMMDGLSGAEGIVRDRGTRGDDVTDELTALASRRAEVEGYARRNGLRTRRWRPDDHAKALADKHGRGGEYFALLVTHQFVHGSAMAISQRYSKTNDNVVEVGGPAANLGEWAHDAGLFAAISTLHAARATCRIFDVTEPAELHALLTECEEAAQHGGSGIPQVAPPGT